MTCLRFEDRKEGGRRGSETYKNSRHHFQTVAPFWWEQAGACDPAVPARKVGFRHFCYFEIDVMSPCVFECEVAVGWQKPFVSSGLCPEIVRSVYKIRTS